MSGGGAAVQQWPHLKEENKMTIAEAVILILLVWGVSGLFGGLFLYLTDHSATIEEAKRHWQN